MTPTRRPDEQTSGRPAQLTVKVVNEDGTEQAYTLDNPTQEQRDHVLAFAPAVALLPRSDVPDAERTAEQIEDEEANERKLMAAKMADATPAVTAEDVPDPVTNTHLKRQNPEDDA